MVTLVVLTRVAVIVLTITARPIIVSGSSASSISSSTSSTSSIKNSNTTGAVNSNSNSNSNSSNCSSGKRSIQAFRSSSKTPSKEVQSAIDQCTRAIDKPHNDANSLKGPSFCRALIRQSLHDTAGALEDFLRAFERNPSNALAAMNAASIYESLGRDKNAVDMYKQAMSASDEASEPAFNKLIPILLRTNQEKAAQSECEAVLRSGRSHMRYAAFEKLGATLHKNGKLAQALEAYQSAEDASYNPDFSTVVDIGRQVEALNHAALAAAAVSATEKGKANEELAEQYFLRACELNATHADTRTNYGVFLKYCHRTTEAIEQLQTAIALDPAELSKETGYAIVQLASLVGGSSSVMSMSERYVKDLFNGYAERFDSELCENLAYRGHEHVVEALAAALRERSPGLTAHRHPHPSNQPRTRADCEGFRVVDAGCGTGLCGPLLREHFPHCVLTGVDLSPRMLEKAALRGNDCYDALVVADAAGYLSGCDPSSVDAIVAADVYIYIGELTAVLAASHAALSPAGLLVFTVEELPPDDPNGPLPLYSMGEGGCTGIKLLSVGRFGHSEKYVRQQADGIGFAVAAVKRETLRLQAGVPVQSITFTLTKAQAQAQAQAQA